VALVREQKEQSFAASLSGEQLQRAEQVALPKRASAREGARLEPTDEEELSRQAEPRGRQQASSALLAIPEQLELRKLQERASLETVRRPRGAAQVLPLKRQPSRLPPRLPFPPFRENASAQVRRARRQLSSNASFSP
jgi:hypothetical protein